MYKHILFNLTGKDSIQLNSVAQVTINSLGGGDPIKALKSRKNIFKIGNTVNYNQQ